MSSEERHDNSQLPSTLQYYEDHAEEYVDATTDIDMRTLYERFLSQLQPGARILDVGCGSGRDLRAFSERGYIAEGIEPCEKLARIAQQFSGRPVTVQDAQSLLPKGDYDGVWACASVLHVHRSEQHAVISRLILCLKPGGVLYISFKKGDRDRVAPDGRLFSDHTMESLKELVSLIPEAAILDCWESEDRTSQSGRQSWVNMLVERSHM